MIIGVSVPGADQRHPAWGVGCDRARKQPQMNTDKTDHTTFFLIRVIRVYLGLNHQVAPALRTNTEFVLCAFDKSQTEVCATSLRFSLPCLSSSYSAAE